MWTNALLARKNFISSLPLWKHLQGSIPSFLPSLFQNTYKVPFIPSFSMVRHWKRGREDVHKVCGCERERESVFVISQSLKDCFSKLKIVIN
jgi:hypothetical protein